MNGQPVLRTSLRQSSQYPLGIVPSAEYHYRVVCESYQECPSPQLPLHYLGEPLVEYFVQVDIAQ